SRDWSSDVCSSDLSWGSTARPWHVCSWKVRRAATNEPRSRRDIQARSLQRVHTAACPVLAAWSTELDPVWWTQETGIREMSIKEVQACRERIDHTHLSFVPRPFVSCVRAANP